eukprot:TRINITY_DN26014_c0_g1_i2.p1 TRINITY_DN26014_c0_g1~~TRINITY_DN26014_c0_g1_i2.p1  ORF type:complete len:647 (+),score=118.05 TRINITY_DN26014_c0_g1_i2:117-2057(+)
MAEASRRKVLVTGDAEGRLSKVFAQVENQQKRIGKFDLLFAAGAFLPDAAAGKEGAEQFASYVSGKEQAPVQTYFIESKSAALLQTAAQGKQLCENIHFLGGYGIQEIDGLQVAYLSGRYDPSVYDDAADSVATPDFVGAAFTVRAVKGLLKLAKDEDRPPIDILLTADWPRGLETRMLESERPKDPDGKSLDFESMGAPPIAELCLALEPRYHVFATSDLFYQRPPYQCADRGHVCRCIGLGKVGSKGKGRLWIHALQLSPASAMPEAALRQRPDNTTPCPFLPAGPAPGGAAAGKRAAAAGSPADEATVQDLCECYLANLPKKINEKRFEVALKHCGTITSFRLARDESEEGKPCRGFGWVTFATPEEAQAACKMDGLLECNGKPIAICLSKRKPGEGPPPKKRREIQIKVEPHHECWFCLVNPNVEKHMIITATTDVYVAGTRGPINPLHVLVLPVKHAPCFAACPSELQEKLSTHVAAIRKMCQEAGKDCIVWERWIPMGNSAANHMQIQVVPVDRKQAGEAMDALEAVAEKRLSGAKLKRVAAHSDVINHLKDTGDATSSPYIYFEIPGDNTARGRTIERFVYAGSREGPRVPMNLGREVACHLLGCENKVDWKQCVQDRDAEKALAAAFRDKFKAFQPRK